ncbi:complex I subunit 1 family protein [Gemmata sp. JC717]|uniref:NADH-quinone oxidoreductase subunit H n=1 Tax=Gemmata algarum TaxID=2975278 RepID=A0ABU5FBJ6_9BACT|nr:complex I subunit 1 family protein [Gemmata algarum]MDY3554134.1 complex I subunit 1 family protein [Gemmata algarum]MDY3563201.1 NADH-quinone oxidoreductase subunit H [Gemmata algarum]
MPTLDPLVITAILIVGLIGGVLGVCGYLTLGERKISAWMQDRVGPNRVGPGGLLQPLADGGKFFLKEEVIPDHVDKVFYLLAPAVAVGTALLALAVVPFGQTTPPPDAVVAGPGAVATFEGQQKAYQESLNFAIAPGLDIGVLYIFALGSLAVYGVILAGWSANNKYSLLGALRSSAQIVSYEIPLGMSVLGVFLIVGSLNPEKIIAWQAGASSGDAVLGQLAASLSIGNNWWLVLFQPLALLLFLASGYAESSRLPFDLPEAEQELVGGYHTEYSSLKLGLMLLTEYVHLVTGSFMVAVLFLGGWSFFGLEAVSSNVIVTAVLKLLILVSKMVALCVFAQFVRWTIPRFRFDQLMNLAWKVMIPLALLNLLAVIFVKQFGWPLLVLTGVNVVLFFGAGVLGARTSGTVTNPKRKVVKLPPGLPAGVTYAGR